MMLRVSMQLPDRQQMFSRSLLRLYFTSCRLLRQRLYETNLLSFCLDHVRGKCSSTDAEVQKLITLHFDSIFEDCS